MNNFLLKFISLLNPIWRRLGADVNQLHAILSVKLKMDSRRASPLGKGLQQKEKKKKNNNWSIVLANLFMGLFTALLIPGIEDKTAGLTIYFSMWMVYLSMTIITDFTDVLIDVRDNYILLPKPVNDRTITLSRILHIFLYLSKHVFFYILPAVVLILFTQPIGLPVFLFQCLVGTFMVVVFVSAFYLMMLRFITPSRFKDLINYFQIAFTILIFGAYYTLPKLVDMTALSQINILGNPMAFLIPPAWIAAFWAVLVESDYSGAALILSSLSIGVTVMGTYLVATVLAKNLNRKMMAMVQGGGVQKEIKNTTENAGLDWGERLSRWVTSSGIEAAAFQFTWAQISRNRDYKLKTYPSLAFIPILFVYFAIDGDGALSDRFVTLQASNKYLFLIYICVLMIATPITNAVYSDKSKSAWIFKIVPVDRPGIILSGVLKAVFSKYLFPVYVLMTLVGLLIWGLPVLDDFLFGFFVAILFSIMAVKVFYKSMPFSVSWTDFNKGSNFANGMLSMLIVAVGFLHAFLIGKPEWMFGVMILLAVLSIWAYRQIVRMEWHQLTE